MDWGKGHVHIPELDDVIVADGAGADDTLWEKAEILYAHIYTLKRGYVTELNKQRKAHHTLSLFFFM